MAALEIKYNKLENSLVPIPVKKTLFSHIISKLKKLIGLTSSDYTIVTQKEEDYN